MSIVFDRAVEYYDQTRSLPPERHAALIEALVREAGMTPDARVLEVGIGTGRIGLSVAAHAQRLFGIDLSIEMMDALRRKQSATNLHIELAQADAGRLPFANDTFDVAYAVHVYHLVSGWQLALLEARRALKPGGRFVVSFHTRDEQSPNVRLRRQLNALIQPYGLNTKRPGTQSEQELYDAIKTWDPTLRIAPVKQWDDAEIPEELLHELDRQIFSETWMIPRKVMAAVMPKLRDWAANEFGDLTQPIGVQYASRWLVATKG